MEFNAGIITPNLEATKAFYTRTLGWRVNFENDFYLLLGTESGSQISFLQPNHPSQAPLFQTAFNGQGIFITVEVPDEGLIAGVPEDLGVVGSTKPATVGSEFIDDVERLVRGSIDGHGVTSVAVEVARNRNITRIAEEELDVRDALPGGKGQLTQ